jgi:hypothetical protein
LLVTRQREPYRRWFALSEMGRDRTGCDYIGEQGCGERCWCTQSWQRERRWCSGFHVAAKQVSEGGPGTADSERWLRCKGEAGSAHGGGHACGEHGWVVGSMLMMTVVFGSKNLSLVLYQFFCTLFFLFTLTRGSPLILVVCPFFDCVAGWVFSLTQASGRSFLVYP